MDGFEVLEWLRSQPRLRRMLVVVFSSSDDPKDVQRAYALGANSYLVKPRDPKELVRVVERLQSLWSSIESEPAPLGAEVALLNI